MDDVLWANRFPGEDVAVGEDELGGFLISSEQTDWIRTPAELGRQRFRVATVYWRDCPCRANHKVKTYTLIGTNLQVSECTARGFLWWTPRAPSSPSRRP